MAARGFTDLHIHGMGAYDTRAERAGEIVKLAGLCGEAGVSGVLPAVYPAPVDVMRRRMAAVREAMELQGGRGARLLGVHLEGPFLNPLRRGALDGGAFLQPSVRVLRELVKGFEDVVKVMTLAPELKGALRVIEKCASLGIRVNMGHSDATLRQALLGKKAGATGVTHLFNAMRPFHHREPGLAGLGLLDEDLYVEVIGDGVHLSAETLRLVFRIKPGDRIILVSDSIKGPMYKGRVLQGAKASLPQAVKNLRDMGVPEEAVLSAASENPRRYLRAPLS